MPRRFADLPFRGALVRVDSGDNPSITTGTWIAPAYLTEIYDTNAFHIATTNERFTIPSGVDYVVLTAQIAFANNGTGVRRARFTYNGSASFVGNPYTIVPSPDSTEDTIMLLVSSAIATTAGDYFEIDVWQDTGGDLALTVATPVINWFAIEAVK